MTGKGRWLLIAVLVAAPAIPVDGQVPSRRGGARPMAVDRAAARALEMAEELELSEAQRVELRAVRSEALAATEVLERERLELRQELRALRRQNDGPEARDQEQLRGLRADERSRMQAFRDRERELTGSILERYEGVLEAEQRLQLRELRREGGLRARRGSGARSGMNRGRSEFRNRRGDRDVRGGRGDRAGRRWRGR